jgi:alpha-tubulin suppressor-like RCC1 family protein
LQAWGLNDSGQTDIPSGLSNVVAIAAGAGHNLALTRAGVMSAWGDNTCGQATVPSGLSNVVAIACGGWHSLALKRDGTVVAWGAVSTNKLIACGQATVPSGLTNVVQLAGGAVNSLALVGSAPPVTQAVLSSPMRGTNGFNVKLASTRNGRVYQLEFKNSLTDAAWQSLPLQAGTGGSLSFLDPTNSTQRYYRVLQW